LPAADLKESAAREGLEANKAKESDLRENARQIEVRRVEMERRLADFEKRVISYGELQNENTLLKRDLQNIDVSFNKFQLDTEAQAQRQQILDERSTQLAKRYLSETVKSVVSAVGPNNFSACKQRLSDVIARCREIGFAISAEEEARLLADLRREFERAVKLEFERQEQARIKAQIREEEKLKREVERELKQLERERIAIQAALDQALAEAKGQHTAEVERLQARLAEAEEKAKRTISMAEQTKAGHVYVISNIGTLGEGVFKVGMTRRLDPMERVCELGCAAVPFPFDVHMMISCNDAPTLENAIHRALFKRRLNRANPRKEFFKTSVEEICDIVRKHHGEVEFVADPEALEYRQSLAMPEEDAEFIESVYKAADEDSEAMPEG
jgi:hypothetical protein